MTMNGKPELSAESTDAPLTRPTWVRWRIVMLLMAFCFLGHTNRFSIRVAGNEQLMREFGLTATQMGTVYSAFLWTYTLCMTPGGWVIDRLGARKTLVILGAWSSLLAALTGLGGYGVSSVILVLTSFWVVRGMLGAVYAPLHPATSRMISLWIPFRQRAWGNGLIIAAAGLGIAGVSMVFGHLMDWFGWRVAFLVTGAVTGLLCILWAAYSTDRPFQHSAVNAAEQQLINEGDSPGPHGIGVGSNGPWWQLLRNRSLVLITLSYAAVGYLEYLFFYWMDHYFVEVLKMEAKQSRLYTVTATAALVPGMVLGGWVSDLLVRRFGYRIGRSAVPVGGMIVSAAGLYAGASTLEPRQVLLWFSLALCAIGAVEGPFWSTAIELGGRQGGTSGGIFNTGGNTLGSVAPIVTAWVAEHYQNDPWVTETFGSSWRLALYLGSLVCLSGVALWFWIDPAERVPEQAMPA
jgi:sugar phosphate permease